MQDVVGSFWLALLYASTSWWRNETCDRREALPGIMARDTPFVVRGRQASAFKLDMPAFQDVNRIFYLALTPEEEVQTSTMIFQLST